MKMKKETYQSPTMLVHAVVSECCCLMAATGEDHPTININGTPTLPGSNVKDEMPDDIDAKWGGNLSGNIWDE